jgi:hypothetical protein
MMAIRRTVSPTRIVDTAAMTGEERVRDAGSLLV